MSPEKLAEKKRWRQHKRTLRALVMAKHFKESKLVMTQNQLKQESKRVVDQIIAGSNPKYAVAKGDERGEGLVEVF